VRGPAAEKGGVVSEESQTVTNGSRKEGHYVPKSKSSNSSEEEKVKFGLARDNEVYQAYGFEQKNNIIVSKSWLLLGLLKKLPSLPGWGALPIYTL